MADFELIPNADLRIANYPPVEVGGQQVTRTECGVYMEHIPTGLIAISCFERSRKGNRMICLEMILAGLKKREIKNAR